MGTCTTTSAKWVCALLLVMSCTGRNPVFSAPTPKVPGGPDASARDGGPSGGSGGAGGSTHTGPEPDAEAGPVDVTLSVDQPSAPDAPTTTAAGCPATAPAGWVCVEAGRFTMGSDELAETDRDDDETQHQVTITRPFWINATEVTQAEWVAVMGNNPAYDKACGETCPVDSITWFQAIAFANGLSSKEGFLPCYDKVGGGAYDATAAMGKQPVRWAAGVACTGFRLPTEAEWEYAARAGTTPSFSAGPLTPGTNCSVVDPSLSAVAWYCANTDRPKSVAQKQPNAVGLYDVHGNVREWVWDQTVKSQDYAATAVTDPIGNSSGDHRVNRGGGYLSHGVNCRSANRDSVQPDTTAKDIGVRLARSLP